MPSVQIFSALEGEVGITHFIGADKAPLGGTVKSLSDDFVVEELLGERTDDASDLQAKVVRLEGQAASSVAPPKVVALAGGSLQELLAIEQAAIAAEAGKQEAGTSVWTEQVVAGSTVTPAVAALFNTTVDDPKVIELVQAMLAWASPDEVPEGVPTSVDIDGASLDKEGRTAVHLFVRGANAASAWLSGESKFRIARGGGGGRGGGSRGGPKKRKRGGAGGAIKWPLPEEFVRIALAKRNITTHDAINKLARAWNLPSSAFSTAGTKDKTAVTVQHVTVKRVLPSVILGAALPEDHIRLGNVHLVSDGAHWGDAGGNRFTLALREVTGSVADVRAGCESLATRGFVNYFGLQRFGSGEVRSHDVGILMLQRRWKDAVVLLLRPTSAEHDHIREAKEDLLRTGDFGVAYQRLPSWCSAEKKLLDTMRRGPGRDPKRGTGNTAAFDYDDASGEGSPDEAVLRAAIPNALTALMGLPYSLRTMYMHAVQSWMWNHLASARLEKEGTAVVEGDLVPVGTGGKEVREVMADEAAAGTLSLADIVLPVIGHQTQIPTSLRDETAALLERAGLELRHFRNRRFHEFALPGTYRALAVRVPDLEYSLAVVPTATDRVFVTPWDEEYSASGPLALLPAATPLTDDTEKEEEKVTGCRTLVLRFSLPSGTYATMACRELTRLDSHAAVNRKRAFAAAEANGEGEGGDGDEEE
jgi:tRNA pseudouridine13 synthase